MPSETPAFHTVDTTREVFTTVGDTRRLPIVKSLYSIPGKGRANDNKVDHAASPVTLQSDDPDYGISAGKDPKVPPVDNDQTPGSALVTSSPPADNQEADGRSFVEALFSTQLEEPLKLQISCLAHDHDSNIATAVLVAWTVVLSRLSGQESVTVGVGRGDEEGALMHLHILQFDLSTDPNSSQLIERVKSTVGGAEVSQSTSNDLIDPSTSREDVSPQAIFYSYSRGFAQPLTAPISMQCGLELHLFSDGEDIIMSFRYETDRFDKSAIERYAGYLKTVLTNMVTRNDRPVASFDILSRKEKKLLLETWNETGADYPAERCVHHLFQDQVDNSPDAIAVVHGEKVLRYHELNVMANHLAHRLVQAGVRNGDFVALVFERSIELVVTELAILKVGAAYVPIDTRTPADRMAYIVSHTGAKLLVTSEHTTVSTQVEALVLRFSVPQDGLIHEHGVPDHSQHPSKSSLDTAYVMFTSGTTGVPKGVVVSHRSIARGVFNNGFADIVPTDRVALATSPSFSPSTFDLWSALLHGARVVIVDDDTKLDPLRLEKVLVRHQVTSLYMTNTLLLQCAPVIGKTLSQLRYLLLGGEQGQVKAYSTILQHAGPVRLVNRYSSTETPVSAAVYTATSAVSRLERPPIGRPSKNSRMYVLDEYRNPVPIGVVGEMYIGGPGIATGYLNLPDLTAERFLPDPFSNAHGARMYKSGDLARYMPDGNLVCVGRNDDLIKLRGYRIELGEVQTHLVGHPLVRNAAVLAVGAGDDRQLVAYVEADPHERLADTLREHLDRMLPDYMIPAAFVRLDVLPLTSRNKIDRRALPSPDFSSFATRDYVAPLGGTEIALAEIWSKLLRIKRVGRQDNFFMLGGHSVLAMRLMNSVATTFGSQLPISTLFAAPTLAGLARSVSNSVAQGETSRFVISRTSRDGPLNLSYAQQRMWFLAKIGGASASYHVSRALRLHGTLDLASFQNTLDTLYARHESLRCAFPTIDGQPTMRILSARDGLPFVTVHMHDEQDKDAAVKDAAAQEAVTPFDLEQGPLVRARLLQLTSSECVFLITIHHIVTDGWSMGVMMHEINELYEAYSSGLPDPLVPLSIQYPDYAAWQRQQLTQDRLKDQAEYWRRTLTGAPVSIELPTDRPRPPQQSFTGASIPIRFDSQLTHAIKSFSQKHEVTVFMTMLAAWSAVLSRLSGQDDIVIGTPSANRSHQQVEQLIGFFVSTLALRIDLAEEPSVEQLLERIRKCATTAQAHQDLPFEQVVEIVQPPRRTDITPLFQVMFAWQNNEAGTLELKNVMTAAENIQSNVLKFDLELELLEQDGEIVGSLNYSTALFDQETIERHVGYLEAMLRWMTTSSEGVISRAPILGASEKKLLLETWNDTDQPYPEEACLHQLFESQVELSPEAIAVVHDDHVVTYRELNSRANRIAHQLIAVGVKPGDYVILLLDRSIDLVASEIAVLKIGAAYVPIDTMAPVDRQAYIASDCGSKIVLTDEHTSVPVEIPGIVLRVSTEQNHTDEDPVQSEGPATSSYDTAYVMYTSGSTGQPKGVMVPHRGIVRMAVNNGFTDVDNNDRVVFGGNPAFDLSSFELWVSLLNGARIIIINRETLLDPPKLAVALVRHQVTMLCLTAALLHQYVYVIGPTLSKLRFLMGVGEQGLVEAYTEISRYKGRVSVINAYGPTEASAASTAYQVTAATNKSRRLPIGRPISNTPHYLLDEHLALVPIGAVGELYIGGPGVANGYLNRPDLTAERFLPDPFAKVEGARMYKTGDLVRYLPDGNLVFIGRNDNQVKVRGFRIELGEIETRLAEHPQVREAVILVVGEGSENKQLVAYVVAEPQDNLVRTLRAHLSVSLPEYMVPSAFVRMDTFPLTNNGKIDRRALPEPDSDCLAAGEYIAPQGKLEIALAAIWSDLLKVKAVGRHDNFFMLGGHSLLAVRLMNRVSSLGVRMSLSTLFSSPTLAGFSEAIGTSVSLQLEPSHSAIPTVARGGPLELSFEQQRLWLLAQMEGLSEIYHVPFASRLHGPLDHAALKSALNTLFARHESLRTVFSAVDGQPQVHLLPADDGFPLVMRDLRGEQDKSAVSKQVAAQEAGAPFDLEKGPLVRAQLIRLAHDEHVFLMTMHHVVTDGWSMGVMIRELNELYEACRTGQTDPLAPLSIQYPDYAAWQRQQLTQARLKDQAEYWRRTLTGAPVSIELPTDRPRPPQQSFTGASIPIRFDSQLTHAIKAFSQKHEITLFMTMLAAWSAVLSRLSGQDDIVIGTPSANRSHQQVEQLIGFFVSTLALRIDLAEEPSVKQLLERVRKTATGAQAHQDLPFEQVVETVKPPRRADITPLFQVMFAWQNNDDSTLKLHDVEAVSERAHYEVAKFELELALSEKEGEIVGGLNYSTAIFDQETIERHIGYLQAMLRWMTTSSEGVISKAPILGDSEHKLLLETWNNTEQPYPEDACLHQLFESQVQLSPEAIAVVHDDQVVTYRELNSRANRIARQLNAVGVKPGDYVILLLDRSIDLVASEIAVLKIGAAYVPIDTKAPADRQAYIASDCGSTVMITDESTVVSAEIQGTLIHINAKQKYSEDGHDSANLSIVNDASASSHDTAYVMYTSGSTGQPKGVMVPHRSIVNFITNSGFVELGPDDVLAFLNNPSFDPSTYDVWAALAHGARIVVIDKDTTLDPYRLAEELVRHQVTILNTNNGLLHQYAYLIGDVLSRLKYLIAGSEQGSCKAYSAILQHGGPVRVDNQYGPTEATVSATSYTATGELDQLERLPIGRPISNSRAYILDKHHNPVPVGVVGELYIGGHGVANGYLNRPDLTAERFLPDPFAKVQGARMYRTGDLVRYLPDGNLVFIGRNDNQVKVRGFRIELGEIEARLAEHPQVREAVVLALGEASDDKRLVAYVVAEPHDSLFCTLRAHLSVSLPEYMVPSAFVRMDAFPLTNNDKIDRRALPEPNSDCLAASEYIAPQGELEIALAAIWSDLLKVKAVGRHDNFFMLGGHSLLAVRLMNRVSSLGVRMSLSTLFSSPTLAGFSEAIGTNVNLQLEPSHSAIPTIARGGPLELSFEQQRLWLLAQMEGLSEIYHVPFASRLHGPLDHAALKSALNTLFARHESLRTVFSAVDGQPQVHLLPADDGFPLVMRDLRGEKDKSAVSKQVAAQEAGALFDLEKGPLVRAQLIQLADDEHFFLMTMHHVVTDGWSMGVMIRELNELYEACRTGQTDPLAPLSIQYPDYAAWQRQQLTQARLKDQAEYWRRTLTGAPVSIELPTDRPRPPQQSFTGASIPIRFDSQLTHAIKAFSQKHEITLFMTMLAAWSAVLSRLSGQDDIVIGTPSANRSHQQVEQLIGFFVSTLALRIDLAEEPSVKQLLERVRKTATGAQAHQDLPFEQVVETVKPPRRADITPLFQVMFAWQNNDDGTLKLHDVEAVSESVHYEVAKFELELALSEKEGEIFGGLNYSTAIFDQETIERHIGYLQAMLRWMTTSSEGVISRAPILGDSEQKLLLETWNNTEQPYPEDACLHQLFESQVELSPEAIAVVHDDHVVTYRELNSRANCIARQLIAVGVKPGDYVILLLDRSIDLVASEIAVLKIGAAYVPIDTKAPVDRQAYIASDCGSKIVLTDENTSVPVEIPGIVLRVSTEQNYTDDEPVCFEGPATSSHDTAYVMYTSGSTGQPKGVMASHQGIVRVVINSRVADLGVGDRVAFAANPAFDSSTYEVWAPLLHGARIIIIHRETLLDPPKLATALGHHEVTLLFLTTALLHQYVYVIGRALSKLRFLLAGGEQGLVEAFTEVSKHEGRVAVIGMYGPTETTVFSTAYPVTSAAHQFRLLPIGRPISNTPQYVLDEHLSPVPLGVVGELYIGGPGVANGYLNRPELTAERFIADPFAKVEGARMYKSGDLVRHLPDGNLAFVGRNDHQVKIRGFRIELGEIEARLAEHPQVRESVVHVLGDGSDDKRLVAYVVADSHENLVDGLHAHLSVSLPEYMVPSAFVRMDALPLTNNGKIDRRALPSLSSDAFVTCDYVPPEGRLEIALAAMWSELLKIEKVGRHDDFFMLGGHSLLAVRMISAVRESLGVDLKLHMIFSAPTLAGLAQILEGDQTRESRDDEFNVLIPLKPQGSRPPLFCIHPGLGLSWSYRDLVKYLHSEQPLYGLQARGADGVSPFARSIEEMTLDYIDQIRGVQPHGPYYLLGRSFGGAVAHSMAVELQKQGESVPLLVIMDVLPGSCMQDEEMEAPDEDEQIKFEEYVARLVGDTMTDVALKKLVERVLENNARLLRVFMPSVYNGDCMFIRATARKTLDAACWAPFVRGNIEILDIDCTHDEMDKPEHIAVTGLAVAAAMEKLQS
ncbi:unnamed protein product [Mortierella alpina]